MQKTRFRTFIFSIIFAAAKSEILLDFGNQIDNLNPKVDDGCGNEQKLNGVFNFYGSKYSSFWVCNNGFVSFSGPNSAYSPIAFPIPNLTMIAPFWADLDNRPGDYRADNYNKIFWRLDSSISTRRQLSKVVSENTANDNFSPDWAIVATWFKVGYFDSHIDRKNTFQVALSCEGEKVCYCFLSYEQIQWTESDLQKIHAQAGFNDIKGNTLLK